MSKVHIKTKPRGRSPSWQVIYMDLMTIIMVFFVIIWSLSQGKDDGISETMGDVTTRLINLPGDVLFAPGDTKLSGEGKGVLSKLFKDDQGQAVLSFQDNGIVKRMIVFHGHTDSDGSKASNLQLGFNRALSAYEEIRSFSPDLQEHVVICSHADNSSEQEVPLFSGKMTPAQRKVVREIKGKNRRITIEDRSVNAFEDDQP